MIVDLGERLDSVLQAVFTIQSTHSDIMQRLNEVSQQVVESQQNQQENGRLIMHQVIEVTQQVGRVAELLTNRQENGVDINQQNEPWAAAGWQWR